MKYYVNGNETDRKDFESKLFNAAVEEVNSNILDYISNEVEDIEAFGITIQYEKVYTLLLSPVEQAKVKSQLVESLYSNLLDCFVFGDDTKVHDIYFKTVEVR